MDEILEKFETTLFSHQPNDSKTRYDGLYKNWGKLGSQEERRKALLAIQKTDRNSKLDRFRGILELVNAVEDDNKSYFTNEKVYYRPNIYVAGFNKTSPTYHKVLMMSEWMIEKPEDFHENWYVTPCPKGTRALVVASQGTTKCYSKYGQFLLECRTALPGGSTSNPRRNQCCVLDCFYLEKTKTMYVLDLLAWNNQPMTDGETDFRYYWLQTELKEIDDLKVINNNNKLIFKLLPKVECTPELFNEFMMKWPHFENFNPILDGFLFYHKKAHYIAGETPLVGWLYPYMVPEVLGEEITVNDTYLIEKPTDYVNQRDFIQKFEARYPKQKGKNKRSPRNSMDTADKYTEKNTSRYHGGTEKQGIQMESEVIVTAENTDLMDSETITEN